MSIVPMSRYKAVFHLAIDVHCDTKHPSIGSKKYDIKQNSTSMEDAIDLSLRNPDDPVPVDLKSDESIKLRGKHAPRPVIEYPTSTGDDTKARKVRQSYLKHLRLG